MQVNGKPITGDSRSALAALEQAGYKTSSECRDGFCGACRLKASGTPVYFKEPIGYRNAGEILVCCVDSRSDINIQIP